MAEPAAGSGAPSPRKPRLLWANCYCLLDNSSGASLAVREMLIQLERSGFHVVVLGCTVFDSERGIAALPMPWDEVRKQRGKLVSVRDGALEHKLFVTGSIVRTAMNAAEAGAWYSLYQQALDKFRPDVVFYYGGQVTDLLIPQEARARGIPSVFYLANGNYHQGRWCRDVDLVLTDSRATAALYKERLGLDVTPVGAFIDPARVVAPEHTRARLLFVNPNLEKGAAIVIRLAMLLEKRRPDIVFEVVESRGKWAETLARVTEALKDKRESLSNVVVTPSTNDMRPIFGRARVLLAPSLWWESGGRVVAEAMLNGIPAIITDHGGMPELAQDAAITLRLSKKYHTKPYQLIPPDEGLQPVVEQIEALFDDPDKYAALSERAAHVGRTLHRPEVSTQRLLVALKPLVLRWAGNNDQGSALRAAHRHGLDEQQLQAAAAGTAREAEAP